MRDSDGADAGVAGSIADRLSIATPLSVTEKFTAEGGLLPTALPLGKASAALRKPCRGAGTKPRRRKHAATGTREHLRSVLEQANCLLWQAHVRALLPDGWNPDSFDPRRDACLDWALTVINEPLDETPSWLPVAREQGETIAEAWGRSRDPHDEIAAHEVAAEALFHGKPRYTQTFRNRMADGTIRWMYEDVRIEEMDPLPMPPPGVGGDFRHWWLTGVVTDITGQRQAEESRLALADHLQQITTRATCMLWQATVREVPVTPGLVPCRPWLVHPTRRTILDWSSLDVANEQDVLGWLPIEIRPNERFLLAWGRARHPDDVEETDRRSNHALFSGNDRYTQSFRLKVADGTYRWLQEDVRIEALEPEEKRGPTGDHLRRWQLTGVVTDITERKKAEESLWWRANHDSLTGLFNRQWIRERIDRDLACRSQTGTSDFPPECAALFVLDLDGFKYINDSLGHSAGDRFIEAAAARLSAALCAGSFAPGQEPHVARLGGDEFLVWMPQVACPVSETSDAATAATDTDPSPCRKARPAVHRMAEQLLQAISHPVLLDFPMMQQREVLMTASIGIALFPDDGMDTDTLLKNADTALYLAKEAGRGKYRFYNPERSLAVANRLVMETRLRQAVRDRTLTIFYQPQVDRENRKIVAVEALLRWTDEELGCIPPTTFIPLAEEIGLIHALGEFALREACLQVARWRQNGFPSLRMSVNLSALQLLEAGMLNIVVSALEEAGLPGDALELEITESVLFRSGEQGPAQFLRDIRARGIRLAIDDFGTGYSSLSYLRNVPVDVVKIDRGFTREILDNRQTQAIVQAIIDLSHALSFIVTAEGVETEEQHRLLAAMSCDLMQGFHFSRAITADRMGELLEISVGQTL